MSESACAVCGRERSHPNHHFSHRGEYHPYADPLTVRYCLIARECAGEIEELKRRVAELEAALDARIPPSSSRLGIGPPDEDGT